MSRIRKFSDDKKYGKPLIKEYGFNDCFCGGDEPKIIYEHCKKNSMRFLKDTYGTIVTR